MGSKPAWLSTDQHAQQDRSGPPLEADPSMPNWLVGEPGPEGPLAKGGPVTASPVDRPDWLADYQPAKSDWSPARDRLEAELVKLARMAEEKRRRRRAWLGREGAETGASEPAVVDSSGAAEMDEPATPYLKRAASFTSAAVSAAGEMWKRRDDERAQIAKASHTIEAQHQAAFDAALATAQIEAAAPEALAPPPAAPAEAAPRRRPARPPAAPGVALPPPPPQNVAPPAVAASAPLAPEVVAPVPGPQAPAEAPERSWPEPPAEYAPPPPPPQQESTWLPAAMPAPPPSPTPAPPPPPAGEPEPLAPAAQVVEPASAPRLRPVRRPPPPPPPPGAEARTPLPPPPPPGAELRTPLPPPPSAKPAEGIAELELDSLRAGGKKKRGLFGVSTLLGSMREEIDEIQSRRDNERELERSAILNSIRELPYDGFEAMVHDIFRRDGYLMLKAESAVASAIDLECQRNGERVFVQYHSRGDLLVNEERVREVHEAVQALGADLGFVFTDGTFTWGADELARTTGVVLVDGHVLCDLMEEITMSEHEASSQKARMGRRFKGFFRTDPPA